MELSLIRLGNVKMNSWEVNLGHANNGNFLGGKTRVQVMINHPLELSSFLFFKKKG